MSLIVQGSLSENKYINTRKIVTKPWGREIWLVLNDKYCYKRIEITAGFKTSYQLHNYKLETNYIIQGTAEVWLENDEGIVESFIMKEGDFFTVVPKRKHRVIAITDIILQEVSTPEVDDIIRLNDEFNRSDGRILEEHLKPVVCILAAGTGSRLEQLSKTCHKALLPLKNKAILSDIIDKFDETFDLVIAVGYLKDQIKEYVQMFHPSRSVRFIDVLPFEGAGSGPAYSLECCRSELQRPFYFCVSDFYTETALQNPVFSKENWIGLATVKTPQFYSTVKISESGIIEQLINKSKTGFTNAFTGIFYMYDWDLFWKQFDTHVDERKEIVDVFKSIQLFHFKKKDIHWRDSGTLALYQSLCYEYDGDKLYLHNIKNDFKYKKGRKFIKKIDTINKIEKLFARSEYLKPYIPKLLEKGRYFFSYEFFEGKTLYEWNTKDIYLKFLDWYFTTFAQPNCSQADLDSLKPYTDLFYKDKTFARVDLFRSTTNFAELDAIPFINDRKVGPIQSYLDQIDWAWLSQAVPTRQFHGDLQFDNVIYNGSEFKLIDWREEFGGNVELGDLYYDLAKLYGGMQLNYSSMKTSSNYSARVEESNVVVAHLIDPMLMEIADNEFTNKVVQSGFNMKKVKLLTALIFLNMAPLHINQFNIFLFFKAKLFLSELLNDST